MAIVASVNEVLLSEMPVGVLDNVADVALKLTLSQTAYRVTVPFAVAVRFLTLSPFVYVALVAVELVLHPKNAQFVLVKEFDLRLCAVS